MGKANCLDCELLEAGVSTILQPEQKLHISLIYALYLMQYQQPSTLMHAKIVCQILVLCFSNEYIYLEEWNFISNNEKN